jgi:hypothetical protein
MAISHGCNRAPCKLYVVRDSVVCHLAKAGLDVREDVIAPVDQDGITVGLTLRGYELRDDVEARNPHDV